VSRDAEWNVPFAWGPRSVSPQALLTSVTLTLAFASLYLHGVVAAARVHILFEVGVAVALPLALAWGGCFKVTNPRIVQLVWFESTYNLLAIVNQLALMAEAPDVARVLGYGFGGFFALQVYGFIAFEIGDRRYLGAVASACLGGLIFWWLATAAAPEGAIDAAGRFLMWGEEAPLAIRVAYAVWVVNALACDLNDLHLRLILIHAASVAVALGSGEFFHARLLTASHLFVLDLAFQFTRMPSPTLPEDFAHLPLRWRRWYFARLREPLTWLSVGGVVAITLGALLGGLDFL